MNKRATIALVGIGGFGNFYVTSVLDALNGEGYEVVAAIDPMPERCARLAELKAKGTTLYSSLEEFYATGGKADLVVLSSPIQWHSPHTVLALEHGSNVLCEKPIAASMEEVQLMTAARDRVGKQVAIGYQWSFNPAIHRLKKDIMSGLLGAPKQLRCMVFWPRGEDYYRRNQWAGVQKSPDGRWVLDSPVNNACAHYLHNMLFVLGKQVDRAADVARVTAELYRANPIQNYDTAALRCETVDGAEIIFVASHATSIRRDPMFVYEFEKATVRYVEQDLVSDIQVEFKDGTKKSYGSPNEYHDRKLWSTLKSIAENRPVQCGIETATPHLICVLAAQQSSPVIHDFPADVLKKKGPAGSQVTSVCGLEEVLEKCFQQGLLPSELGASWAQKSKVIDLRQAPTARNLADQPVRA